MSTPTPRTDAEAIRWADLSPDEQWNRNGEYVPAELARQLKAELQAASLDARRLREALQNAKITHLTGEDCWYSCPKSGECCNEFKEYLCDCGADVHNAAIDAALSKEAGHE